MALKIDLDEPEPLNMTPMLDVVFNLLIFFLLGSSYMDEEKRLPLHLPRVGKAEPISAAPVEITVEVLADGGLSIEGRPYDLDLLRRRMTEAVSRYPDQAVVIRGDRGARYESVAKALSVCRAAGIRQLDLVVQED
jgi:biopolymer transport protein ExbD